MPDRQLTDIEKNQVRISQTEADGSLRCYISGEIISQADEIEFDHLTAWSKGGPTDLVNVRIVKKIYNRRKKDESLDTVKDNFQLEKLFLQKQNNIKLQDILELKGISNMNIHLVKEENVVKLTDSNTTITAPILYDKHLDSYYFYSKVPLSWIQNDDQEGLQPRVIDLKRLVNLRDHLKSHPQLSPAIARYLKNSIRLFDGQHKTAAQILNNAKEVDVKVFLSTEDEKSSKNLFDSLMITNLEAHSKLRQVPFYTSTLLERLSTIQKEMWEEFSSTKPSSSHSEENFIKFLIIEKQFEKSKANSILFAALKENVLSSSALEPYVAEASKDPNYPITQDLLATAIYPNTIYLHPSSSLFDQPNDFRNSEVENFKILSKVIVESSHLADWIPSKKNESLNSAQKRVRRIWHKGAVLTWGPYMKDIIINVFNILTEPEREKLLYRAKITNEQTERLEACFSRLFSHSLWDSTDSTIDSLLVSSRKQDELFNKLNLTRAYVLTGNI
ncbi:ParB-like nuclease family protein [Leptospira meyeri]|uniref:ParB-like nuclease family protein n=1 Tax=Leptospira meyeri TaxID=29508 RepID=A0A4V3HHN9_LEPME|nr:ParB N-terminal domain-containing protein [Leptospira meyeri]EKJ86112.1 ParB-like protein [Leptospira meyeri serovar Hardjo str. Went 5]TDY66366.1 ParB-like nuclease family protein [Leptospira meyeri]